MGLWTLLTGGQTATPDTRRTPRDRARRNREISRIDARTTAWLQAGGLTTRKRGR